MSVGGVSSYGYPHHPVGFDAKAYTEDLIEDLDKFKPQPIDNRPKPLNFIQDKLIEKTNEELKVKPADNLRPLLPKPEEITRAEIVEFDRKLKIYCARLDAAVLEAETIQRDIYQTDTVIAGERVQNLQKELKAMQEEINDTAKTMGEKMKKSNIVGWIDTVTTMGYIALSVISLGLAVITGGLSLGLTAGLVVGLGIAKGATTIASGAMKYEIQKDEATMAGLQHAREDNQAQIQKIVDSLKASSDAMKRLSQNTTEFLNTHYKATVAQFRK